MDYIRPVECDSLGCPSNSDSEISAGSALPRTADSIEEEDMKFDSVDAVLDYAIEKEQDAHDFYIQIAGKMSRPYMKEVFEGFAKEELGHKRKIEGIKSGKLMLSAEKQVMDLKIGDHLVDVDTSGDMDYQQALIVAMKAEKNAFILYNDLASATDSADLRNTFLALAQEEAKHKLRFEIEYDDYALKEN
jgi:rubrerythrin